MFNLRVSFNSIEFRESMTPIEKGVFWAIDWIVPKRINREVKKNFMFGVLSKIGKP